MSVEHCEKFFRAADKDNSNSLTFEEMCEAMRNAGFRGTNSQLKSTFNMADSSGDNLVTIDEFLVMAGAIPESNKREARMRYLFREYDKDGSGEITQEELKAVFNDEMKRGLSDQEIERMVFLMEGGENAVRDGKVNFEEFIKYTFNEDSN